MIYRSLLKYEGIAYQDKTNLNSFKFCYSDNLIFKLYYPYSPSCYKIEKLAHIANISNFFIPSWKYKVSKEFLLIEPYVGCSIYFFSCIFKVSAQVIATLVSSCTREIYIYMPVAPSFLAMWDVVLFLTFLIRDFPADYLTTEDHGHL